MSFDAFIERVQKRMDKGAQEYGDRSFARAPEELVQELQEEVEDIAGWGYILWNRLENIK